MNKHMFTTFTILVFIACIYSGSFAQITDVTVGNLTVSDLTTIFISTTTEKTPTNISCEAHNNDCKACVANSQCYYCDENSQCHLYIVKDIAVGECSMNHVHYLTCRVSFKTLAIIIGSLIGVAILIITIVCCYCCCKRKGIKLSKDDLKWARQREERKQIAAERRKERAERTEEIRKKYGLVKDSNPYQRFDA